MIGGANAAPAREAACVTPCKKPRLADAEEQPHDKERNVARRESRQDRERGPPRYEPGVALFADRSDRRVTEIVTRSRYEMKYNAHRIPRTT
jgi:hypothetical protein